MNPLVYITISLYFKISNAAIFGGTGTVGYSSTSLGGAKNFEPDSLGDSFILKHREIVANQLDVSVKDVEVISKEEYDLENDDDCYDDSDDDDYGYLDD